MSTRGYQVGDLVFSRVDLYNDGGVPDVEEQGLLATAGTRGVVVKTGSAQARLEVRIYLVRFEGSDQVLGPPVGCLDEELTQDEASIEGERHRSGEASAEPAP
ncbi:MAG TPA: nitrogen fixation protein NifZ [Polyangiaceae bacterium]|nr:nitrogen fixation protein NifZ [Polyangiaceae bacterium]